MSRLRLFIAAAAVAVTVLPARVPAAFADTSTQTPTLDQLNAGLGSGVPAVPDCTKVDL